MKLQYAEWGVRTIYSEADEATVWHESKERAIKDFRNQRKAGYKVNLVRDVTVKL